MNLNVLYQINDKYAPYAGASLTSLFENNKHLPSIRVYILGEKLSKVSEARFRAMAAKYGRQLTFVKTDPLVVMMKKMGMPTYRGSYAANMRLFLPFVLADDVDRLLYLDADTIVDGPLDELITMPMDGHPIAMCLDSLVRLHKTRLGFTSADYYYNSGMILFDMIAWRSLRCSERIANHVKNVRAMYPSPDQDLINVVLKGEILKLPPRYNIQPIYLAFSIKDYFKTFGGRGFYAQKEVQNALSCPVIYHFFRFVGEFPWNSDNVHPDNDLFDKYIKMSPWNDYIKRPANTGAVLKFEKILYKNISKSVFIKLFRLAYEYFIYKANKDSMKCKINKLM